MSDKRTTPGPAEGAGRRKRPGPTIDLQATDVSPESSAREADDVTDARSPDAPAQDHQTEPAGPEHAPGGDDGRWNWQAIRDLTFAGVGGAAAVMAVLIALWFAGLIPVRFAGPAAVDPAVLASLNERMARIEAAPARPAPGDPAIAERMSAAENAMRSLGIAMTALNKRSDEIAARAEAAEKAVTELRDAVQGLARNTPAGPTSADVDALQKRVASLDQAIKTAAADRPARLALAAAALRDAAVRGTPFAAELEEAKSLGAGEKSLAPLLPFAANGVPTAAAMLQDLRTVIPAMVKASGTQASPGGFLDRLQANAGKLVRIRPLDAPAGNDAAAVLARIEAAAARADIDAASTDLAKLDAATRAPAQQWIARAE